MTPATEEQILAVLKDIRDQLASASAPPLAVKRRMATLEEAQTMLNCKRSRLFELMAQKRVTRIRQGGKTGVDVHSIERYLATLVDEPAAAAPAKRGRGRPKKERAPATEAEAIAKLKVE